MSDKASCQFCSREGQSVSTIAVEAQDMVLKAAGDVAGLTIQGQLRKACRALGYRDGHWRIRAAWYGEAESWSAKALEDLRARYRAWDDRQGRLADEAERTLAALRSAGVEMETKRDAEHRQARVDRMAVHAREAAARRRLSP